MPRIIFHIDVNSAFVSWSATKLVLEGKPDYRFHRHMLEDGTDCFEVVEDNKILERHIVQK